MFDNTVKSPNQTNLETYFVSVSSITGANESPSLDKPVQNMVSVSYKIHSQLMCTYQRSHTKLIYSYTSKASRLAPESKTSSLKLLPFPPETKETPFLGHQPRAQAEFLSQCWGHMQPPHWEATAEKGTLEPRPPSSVPLHANTETERRQCHTKGRSAFQYHLLLV